MVWCIGGLKLYRLERRILESLAERYWNIVVKKANKRVTFITIGDKFA